MTILFGADVNGRYTIFLGLTDINLRLMQDDMPLRRALDEVPQRVDELVVFHATHQALVELADVLGLDQVEFLDKLGEG